MKKLLTLLSFIIFISLIIFFQSCKEENPVEPDPAPDTILADNTVQVDSNGFKSNLVSIDSAKIVYSSGNSFTQNLVVGGFLVSDYDEGVLRKIESIQTQGNQIILSTRQAYLDEVILKGKLEFEGELNPENIELESSTRGFKVEKKNGNIVVNFFGVGIGANREVSLDISTEFTPPISKLYIEIDHGLKYFEASVKVTNITTQKTTTTSGAFVQGEITPEWATIKFPGFFIPGTLIWIIPKVKFGLGCQAAIENAITNELKGTITLYGGIKYQNGQWSPIKTINNTFELVQTTTNSFGQITPYLIAPRFGFYIAGIAGPFVDSRFYGRFVQGLENGNPYYAQYVGIKANAGVEVKILGVGISYSATLFDFENELVKQYLGNIPNAPTLSSPANGATNVSLPATLSWNASSGATSYTLQVSENSNFTSFVYNQSGLTETSQQVSGLNNSTQYYWRVSAENSYGNSGWSNVWNFTTASGGTTPLPPVLSSPANGATNVSLPPTLSWNASSGATSYTLQVSTNSNFTSFVFNQSGLTGTSQQVTGLNNSTQYYWRVSATNSYGTSDWSSAWNFTTAGGGTMGEPCPGMPTITDPRDGKIYNTVLIGEQCWLKENMNIGTKTNGISGQWNNAIIEKYCYGDNDANCEIYGGLYQWDEAMQYVTNEGVQGICPPGWHIPTVTEFQTLKATVNNDGNSLKATGTNTSGFSALLAGLRYLDGYFYDLSNLTYFWSSTEYDTYSSSYLGLFNSVSNIASGNSYKTVGLSIRCLKD